MIEIILQIHQRGTEPNTVFVLVHVCFSIVSQLQAEVDNLMMQLNFTQGVSEDLRSDVKTLKNARHKAGAEKIQAEEQKLKQVGLMKNLYSICMTVLYVHMDKLL